MLTFVQHTIFSEILAPDGEQSKYGDLNHLTLTLKKRVNKKKIY